MIISKYRRVSKPSIVDNKKCKKERITGTMGKLARKRKKGRPKDKDEEDDVVAVAMVVDTPAVAEEEHVLSSREAPPREQEGWHSCSDRRCPF